MRLLYITALAPFGEHEAFFVTEIQEWIAQGHAILVAPRVRCGGLTHREAQGLHDNTIATPLVSVRILAGALAEILRRPMHFLKVLGWLLRSRNAAGVARNLAVLPKGLWLGRIARRWRANHIHAQWATTTATMAMVASELSGVPWSFTAHRGDIVQNNLLALKVENASFVRYISQSGAQMAAALGAPNASGKTAVIHMGVRLPGRTRGYDEAPRTPTILCPAKLTPVKGHRYLLEAMAILKKRGVPYRLEIAGGGELDEPLRGLARQLCLDDSVRFSGHLLNEEILDRYGRNEVDIVVLASVDLGNGEHEGIPVCLMEAMASGIPVVSTRTGGIPELLQDDAGIIVPPCDPAALADALEQLIRDAELRRRLGELGRRRIAEEYAIDRVVATIASHLGNCTAPGKVQ